MRLSRREWSSKSGRPDASTNSRATLDTERLGVCGEQKRAAGRSHGELGVPAVRVLLDDDGRLCGSNMLFTEGDRVRRALRNLAVGEGHDRDEKDQMRVMGRPWLWAMETAARRRSDWVVDNRRLSVRLAICSSPLPWHSSSFVLPGMHQTKVAVAGTINGTTAPGRINPQSYNAYGSPWAVK